jgi:transcriptional regulatory protein RtcR
MNIPKPTIVFGLLGPRLDSGQKALRWDRWRPTVSLCQQDDLLVERLELLYQRRYFRLARQLQEDISLVSPSTSVNLHEVCLENPWDLEEVYGTLHDFFLAYPFRPGEEEYLVHITTGTHIEQICLFLLAESRLLPGRLLQTGPGREPATRAVGSYDIIDLDLDRYDRLANRFRRVQAEGLSFLKAGIDTKNAAFNQLMDEIEQVATVCDDPLLLQGPTGAGKTQLARRIFQLRKERRRLEGELVEVNCATMRGEGATSRLFGHVLGAFTGAVSTREGLLRKAHRGLLFLDEIGELGLDEQTMLLRALEEKTFYPVGSDQEVRSDFQLLAGTNRDLAQEVQAGRFREDLFARINLWSFHLPGLRERPEDIEPNLDYELEQIARSREEVVDFTREARRHFLRFATSPRALWRGNFRDFSASLRRLATLATGGRIRIEDVDREVQRLMQLWGPTSSKAEAETNNLLTQHLGPEAAAQLDRFDQVQLAEVLRILSKSRNLAEAGRVLFAQSRKKRSKPNDSDRVRKYLARFGISGREVLG